MDFSGGVDRRRSDDDGRSDGNGAVRHNEHEHGVERQHQRRPQSLRADLARCTERDAATQYQSTLDAGCGFAGGNWYNGTFKGNGCMDDYTMAVAVPDLVVLSSS